MTVPGRCVTGEISAIVDRIDAVFSARIFMKRMLRDAPLPRSVTLRWYNEAPVLILLAILWLVVVKPF